MKSIYLAGGCFWGLEKYLDLIKGVVNTQVGYANGKTSNPTYQEVCYQNTGHAETVRVEYDPAVLSLSCLLGLYFDAIDPTAVNRQGPDAGTQYRTGIYYTDGVDLPVIQQAIATLQQRIGLPVAIEIKVLKNYSSAEEYHQKYLEKNPEGYCHIGRDSFYRAEHTQVTPEG